MNKAAIITTSHDAFAWVESQLRLIKGLQDKILDQDYRLEIQIPNYPHFILRHFQPLLQQDPHQLCQQANIPNAFGFYHFGMTIYLKASCELELHDQDMTLVSPIKQLVRQFGVVTFIHCVLTESIRDLNHFNNFAHLNFHRDRHDIHENHYSLYSRDPRVADQKHPRSASTIFIDNAVAYLQGRVEGLVSSNETGRRGKYEIFRSQNLNPLMGKLFLEQAWDAPTGQGEICIIDNKILLHSSYKRSGDTGYRIGARYLY